MYQDCVTSCSDVRNAISRLKSHKNDGDGKLSTDHFHNAGVDLSVHVGLLFSAIILFSLMVQFLQILAQAPFCQFQRLTRKLCYSKDDRAMRAI